MKNIYESFKKAVINKYDVNKTEDVNNRVQDLYEDLCDNLSVKDINRVNNLFIALCGLSLDTFINSESEDLVEGEWHECYEKIK